MLTVGEWSPAKCQRTAKLSANPSSGTTTSGSSKESFCVASPVPPPNASPPINPGNCLEAVRSRYSSFHCLLSLQQPLHKQATLLTTGAMNDGRKVGLMIVLSFATCAAHCRAAKRACLPEYLNLFRPVVLSLFRSLFLGKSAPQGNHFLPLDLLGDFWLAFYYLWHISSNIKCRLQRGAWSRIPSGFLSCH